MKKKFHEKNTSDDVAIESKPIDKDSADKPNRLRIILRFKKLRKPEHIRSNKPYYSVSIEDTEKKTKTEAVDQMCSKRKRSMLDITDVQGHTLDCSHDLYFNSHQ